MAVVLALGGVVLAGCTDTTSGQAAPNQGELKQYLADNAPLNSADALGDVTSVDYCSLLDEAGVAAAGGVATGLPSTSFDRCALSVLAAGKDLDVMIGYMFGQADPYQPDLDPVKGKQLKHSLLEEQLATGLGPSTCNRYLDFADGVKLQFSAGRYDQNNPDTTSEPPDSLCALASAAVDGALVVIDRKEVRHLDFSAKPLGKVDACSVLPYGFVDGQFGSATPETEKPSKHYCEWGDPHDTFVNLEFSVYQPRPATDGATQETLGNRPSTVIPENAQVCSVETVLGAGFSAAYPDSKQIASFYVKDPAGKDPCAIARALANEAWPKLPAAS
jgi:hypothetical protein